MSAVRRRVARLVVTLAATGAVAVTGPGQVPSASAATATTVSVHVQDAAGSPLRGVVVVAEGLDRDRFVYLGRTDPSGNLTRATGIRGTIRPGTYRIAFVDQNTARAQAGTRMVPVVSQATVRAGYNRVPRVTMALGETIRGSVTAPSGAPIAGFYVAADPTSTDDALDFLAGADASSDEDGHYVLSGLAPGTYAVYTDRDDGDIPDEVAVPVGGATYDVRDVVVAADEVNLSGVASGPGEVTLTYAIAAFGYSGAEPAGTVSIVVDGDRAHPLSAPVSTIEESDGGGPGAHGGKAVVVVSGLVPGTHSFTASYAGTDLTAKRVGITKNVR